MNITILAKVSGVSAITKNAVLIAVHHPVRPEEIIEYRVVRNFKKAQANGLDDTWDHTLFSTSVVSKVGFSRAVSYFRNEAEAIIQNLEV